MIRKSIIAVLTLATVGSVGAWVAERSDFRVRRVFDVGRTQLGIAVIQGRLVFSLGESGTGPPIHASWFTRKRPSPISHWRTESSPSQAWFVQTGSSAPPPIRVSWFDEGFVAAWRADGKIDLVLLFRGRLLCILFGAYPLLTLLMIPARRWRRRRREQGLCLDCGYDLTGNVTGVCSECGSKIEPAK